MSHPVYEDEDVTTRRPRRQQGRDRTVALVAVMVAVVAVLVAVVLAVMLVTGPTSTVAAAPSTSAAVGTSSAASPSTSATKAPGQPRTVAAVRTAATRAFDAYAGGDYGEFWDTWTSQAKQVVSRRDYVRRFKLCPSAATGLRITIQKVTLAGSRASVRTARSILVQTYTFAYQSGRWRYQPLTEQLQPYRAKTVDQIAREERAAGRCG